MDNISENKCIIDLTILNLFVIIIVKKVKKDFVLF